jgi:hypothetical protein
MHPRSAINFMSLPTFEALRQHVLETLCQHDQLDPEMTPLYQGLVTRTGRPCGLFFQVQGPRQVRNYALWAGDENRILFYNGIGQRFAETKLSDAPDPLRAVA